MSLSVKTNQGGYYPGDSILICMEARNNSSQRITAVQGILNQSFFHGHFVQIHHAHLIGQQSIGGVGIYKIAFHTCKTRIMLIIEDCDIRTSREFYNWVDKPLLIPAIDPTVVSTIAICKNLIIISTTITYWL